MNPIVRQFTKQLLTDDTNEVYDIAPVLAGIAFLAGVALAAYSVVVLKHPFSIQDFGIGCGALMSGYGIALGLRGSSSSKPAETKET